MKRLFILLCIATCSMMVNAQMSAHKWVKNVRIGWCLGNALESFNDVDSTYEFTEMAQLEKNRDSETQWLNPRTTRQMIDSVKTAGFNAVRIPIRWYPHFIYKDGNMTIDPVWMNRVHEIVDWCLEDGMQVIINTHHEKWIESYPTIEAANRNRAKFMALWTEIAKSFAGYDNRLAFAGTCELHDADADFVSPASKEKVAVQNIYNQMFVDAVRATGGNNRTRNLLVQTYACEPYYNSYNFQLPHDVVDGHLMAEVHVYAPSLYCMTGHRKYFGDAYNDLNELKVLPSEVPEILWSNDAPYMIMQSLRKISNQYVPVVIGEFGAGRWNKIGADKDDKMLQSRILYYVNMVNLCKKEGFACFTWDNGVIDNPNITYKIFFFDRKNGMKNLDPYVTGAMMKVKK